MVDLVGFEGFQMQTVLQTLDSEQSVFVFDISTEAKAKNNTIECL